MTRPRARSRYVLLFALPFLLLGGLYGLARLLPPPDLTPTVRPSNLILDRHGRLLYEWVDPEGAQHRPVPLDAVAPACIQATLATEDARFFRHPGVDPVAILASVYRHVRYGLPLTGASTLTQQLVRLTLLPPEERYRRSLWRKVKEAWLAWRLERHLSKEEILTLYLNRAYYGNFAVGIEAAAHAYFGRSARTLDLAQCALLAGLPQAPAEWNPLVHPQAAKARQRVVLQRMVEAGYISPAERDRALAEPLAFAATPFPIEAPHFVAMVQAEVEARLGPAALQAGGWVITTTLDLDLQRYAEMALRRHLRRLNRDPNAPPDREVTGAAAVVLDPATGDVLALVGSPNYFDTAHAGAVNLALALRQPGSAIKPIVYAAAFDPTHPHPWAPGTRIADVRTRFTAADGSPYIPENYDRRWHGVVTARVALGASLNVPAVKALRHAGLDRFLALAAALGLDSLARHPHPDLALALGAGEVSLLDLTAAYAAFAHRGLYTPPRLVLAVRHPPDPPQRWPQAPPRPALDPRVAYLVTDILADRYARALTFGLNSALELDRPAAVKTGTTTDWRDAWTIGYTPDLAVGVWVGNWDNTPMKGLSGLTAAAPIWRAIMTFAHRHRPPRAFPQPAGITRVPLCEGSSPSATPCPPGAEDLALVGVPFLRAEPDVARVLPQTAFASARAPEITFLSPDPNAIYRWRPDLPPEEQAIPLAVNAPPGSRVRFWVDAARVGERTAPPYRVWWPLTPGPHRVRAEIRLPNGQRRDIWVDIRVEQGRHR